MYRQEIKWSKDIRKLRTFLKNNSTVTNCVVILLGSDISQITDTAYDDWNNGELGLNLNYSQYDWLYDLGDIDAWGVVDTDAITKNI